MTGFLPERTSVYVEQEDQHMPELSVRETLDFAALCHGTGRRPGQSSAARPCIMHHGWQLVGHALSRQLCRVSCSSCGAP